MRGISGSDAWVSVRGPDNSGFRVTVKVPSRSDLTVDLSAGEIHVAGVEGNKDIESYAGEVHVDVGRAQDYRRVHASVWAGEIKASAFKTSTGAEIRFFMPVLNVPFRLIFALNPNRFVVYDNNLQPERKFRFRFDVGSTF